MEILDRLWEQLMALLDSSGSRRAEAILRRFDASILELQTTSNDLRIAVARCQSDLDAVNSEMRIENKTIERLEHEQSTQSLDTQTHFHLKQNLDMRQKKCAQLDHQRTALQAHYRLLESGLHELDTELGMLRNNRNVLGERFTLASARQRLYRSKGGIGQKGRWELEREMSALVRQAESTAESMRGLLSTRRYR